MVWEECGFPMDLKHVSRWSSGEKCSRRQDRQTARLRQRDTLPRKMYARVTFQWSDMYKARRFVPSTRVAPMVRCMYNVEGITLLSGKVLFKL